jgi:hypothetical protein
VTEQPGSGTLGDIGDRRLNAEIGAGEHQTHHGRPASWVAVTIVIIGFIIGGIALTVGPNWVLFWIGAALVVVGAIFGAANRIMDDWY